MKNSDFNKTVEKFMKWSKICIITTMIIAPLCIGTLLLPILKEFTDIEAKAPFLYGKIFASIALVIFLALTAFEIFCYLKARKYKKLIMKSEYDGDK